MCLNIIHDICTVFALASLVTIMVTSFGSSSENNRLFMTNTFLSTYYTDVPALSYYPSGGSSVKSDQIANTYYDCLFEARVGFDSPTSCQKDNVKDFKTCIIAKTTSDDYRTQKVVDSIQRVLNAYKGDAWNISSLPNLVTNSDLKVLGSDLADSEKRNAVLIALEKSESILSNDIRDAILGVWFAGHIKLGIPACLDMVNQKAGLLHDIAPVYDQLWQCTAGLIYTEAAHRNAYEMCIPQSSWPTIDVMQTPYSSTFLGSYNKHFLLVIGIWIMCSFAVYSFYLGEMKAQTDRVKPGFLQTGGFFLTMFSFLWCVGGVLMAIARSFTSADTASNFPMSVQTVILSVFVTSVSVIYFGREMYEVFQYGKKRDGDGSSSASATPGQSRFRGKGYSSLQTFMTPKAKDDRLTLSDFMPLLLPAWNDCFFLCDGLIFLALVGSAKDVVTADVVLCFFAVVGVAAMNSAVARLFVDTYNSGERDPADEEVRYPLRVMVLGCHIASFSLQPSL